MSPKKSCPKRVHYRTVWLGLLIITTIMAVLTLGFSSMAVHLPGTKVLSEAGNARATRSGSNAISSLNGRRTAEPSLKSSGSRAGRPIVIDSAANMSLEALPDPNLMAAAPAPAPQKANLDQIRNGSATGPTDPADWVNGNAGASTAHYREGYSIAYRMVLTNLTSGSHDLKIEWDIRQSSKAALDYITHYDRIGRPGTSGASHQTVFGHPAEVIDPTIGVSGLGAANTLNGDIPAPSAAGSTVAGQPATSFTALPTGERVMTIYNGTFAVGALTYDSQGSLTASSSSTRLNIHFSTTNSTVVIAWGGHIASAVDWPGASASNVSGSPYHTRLISLDGAGGNQDRSLAAAAVQVDCATCSVSRTDTGPDPVCPGSTETFTSTIGTTGTCDTPAHSWTISGNGTIPGSKTGASVTVVAGSACNSSYTVTDTITCSGCTSNATVVCSKTVNVVDTTAPVIGSPGTSGSISCPTSPVFTAPTATDGCSTPVVSVVSDVITNGTCAGTYSRTVTWHATDACGNTSGNVSQTITVVDTTAPSIGSPGGDATISCPATPVFTPPTASDTCGSATIIEVSDVTTQGSCAGSYTRTKTWKARDCSGNESGTVSQTITVQDTTAPSIGSPGANATIECPASPSFTPPTATDTCDSSPQIIEVSDQTTQGACAGTYTRTKTWKAKDACGNESGTVSQAITVEDTTPPTITCPPDVAVTCKTDIPAAATTVAQLVAQGGSASDSCGDVTISFSDSEPSDTNSCGTDCGGKITRTYTVTDCAGLTDTCEQVITYGTPGSLQTAQQGVIASLLQSGDLVVGVAGTNSLTIPGGLNAKSSAFCLVTKLSASGSASSLADFGDRRLNPATCQTSPSLDLQKDGTWRNVALSQAIQLSLNLRLSSQQEQLSQEAKGNGLAAVLQVGRPDADFDLGSFALTSTLSTQGALPGADGVRGTFDDELDLSSARTQLTIPASVLSALGSKATAADLLRLANAELAGVSTSDAKLSDIAAALDAVNRSYDFGKRRLVFNSNNPAK